MRRFSWVGQRIAACASLLVLLAAQTPAQAQSVPADPPETPAAPSGGEAPAGSDYNAYIERALAAYDGGRHAEARTYFRQANELERSAKTLRAIGMCSFNLGDYLDALANLEAALVEPRNALPASHRTQVNELIAKSQAHVGRFRLRVSPADAALFVDGAPATRLASGELLLEPGRHELMAQAPGHRAGKSSLQVDGGDRTTLELRLEPQQDDAASAKPALTVTDLETGQKLPSVPATAGPMASGPAPATDDGGVRVQRVLGYVALGVAGAGLVSFGVSTGLAAAKKDSLDETCPARQCAPRYHAEVDEFDRLKLISTVSLIGTLSLATVGVVLLVTDSGSAPAERASLTPLIGPGSIGAAVRGRL